jgi:hypothetical protein
MCALCKAHHNMCNLRFWWQWVYKHTHTHTCIYITVFWDVMPCSLLYRYTFERTCCLHLALQPRIWVTAASFRMSVPIYWTTRHHVQEYVIFHIYIRKCKMNKALESIFNLFSQNLRSATFKIIPTPWILLQLKCLLSFVLCNQNKILLMFKILDPNGVHMLCCHQTRYHQTMR